MNEFMVTFHPSLTQLLTCKHRLWLLCTLTLCKKDKKCRLFNFVGRKRMNITIFLLTNILKFHMVTAHPIMPLFQKFSNFQYISAQNIPFNLRKPQKVIQWANNGWKMIWMFMVTVHPFLTRSQISSRNGKVDSPPII